MSSFAPAGDKAEVKGNPASNQTNMEFYEARLHVNANFGPTPTILKNKFSEVDPEWKVLYAVQLCAECYMSPGQAAQYMNAQVPPLRTRTLILLLHYIEIY